MFSNPFTRKGFAKGIAKAHLKSLHTVQKKFSHLSRLESYAAALALRGRYTDKEVNSIITQAVELHEELAKDNERYHLWPGMDVRQVTFETVVRLSARYEYWKTFGHPAVGQDSDDIRDGVASVIPYSV